ncbi:MAG: hypothetical protein WCC84_12370 [Candidatus Cybelea sp.]
MHRSSWKRVDLNYKSGGPIVEYADGGTEQIATLKTSEALTPQDCHANESP